MGRFVTRTVLEMIRVRQKIRNTKDVEQLAQLFRVFEESCDVSQLHSGLGEVLPLG